MKLGVCITAFNGLELLGACIDNYRKFCDEVVVCYQDVSHKGRRDDTVFDKITEINYKRPFRIVKYNPKAEYGVKENERRKHNLMIEAARALGCTHFIMSATDHFYRHLDALLLKQEIQTKDYDVTFTRMYTYYKHPTWQLTPIEDYAMPFICKFNPGTHVHHLQSYPVYVDPSVKITPIKNWYMFPEDELMLHHYSMVREDLKENKFKDAVSPVWKRGLMEAYIKEYDEYTLENNKGVSYFKGRKIVEVPNYFGL